MSRTKARKRGYPDLHDHIEALREAGLLVVVDDKINKDTEMRSLEDDCRDPGTTKRKRFRRGTS